MVKRYFWVPDPQTIAMPVETKDGVWIRYEDYQSLQAALREALERWQDWNDLQEDEAVREQDRQRLAQIRKQFLDI